MSSVRDQYVQAWTRLAELAAEIPEAAWDGPSLCPDWSARQLAGHLVDGERQVRALLEASEPLTPVVDPAALAQHAADPDTALRHAAKQAATTLTDMDAAVMVTTPHGRLPVNHFLTMALIEPVVHGWDLAAATGRPLVIAEQAAETLLAGVKQLGSQLAATGMYASPAPIRKDARPTEQLLAALGRRVDAGSMTSTVVRERGSEQ